MKSFLIIGLFFGAFATLGQHYSLDSLSSINKTGSNYGAQEFHQQLYFVSNRKHRMHASYYSDSTRNSDIFEVVNGKVGFPKGKVNSAFHEGPFTMTPGGDTLIFSRSSSKTDRAVSLYYAVREDSNSSWQEAQPVLTDINTSFMGHPHFSEAGLFYFSSNADGGYGDLDLYKAVFKKGELLLVENLGPEINSSKSEAFPFVVNDVLYFSSNKPSDFKGINIYKLPLALSLNQKPILLPEPFNSNDDDFSFSSYKNGTYGYFSSNREGDDKIYKFNYQFPEFVTCEEQQYVSFCYDLEETAYASADTMPLKFIWDLDKGFFAEGRSITHCFPDTGHYEIKVTLVDTISPDIRFDLANYVLDIHKEVQVRMVAPDTLPTEFDYLFKPDFSHLPGYEIQDVFWDFNGELIKKWEMAYRYTEPGEYYPSISVLAKKLTTGEIEKFCTYKKLVVSDSSEILPPELEEGNGFKYNTIKNSTDSIQKTFELENEEMLFAVQIHESDTLFIQLKERFPEIKDEIFIRKQENGQYSYEVLYTKDVLESMKNTHLYKKIDSTSKAISFYYKNYLNDSTFLTQFTLGESELLLGLEDVFKASGFIAADTSAPVAVIYFDLNSSEIGSKAEKIINQTVANLKPNQKFALYGYADATGTEELNKTIANERVESVYEALKNKGVDESNIVKRGFGSKYATLIQKNGKVIENRSDRKVEIRIIE